MENILKKFYQRLANISTKNKSLVLLQLAKRFYLDLHSFHYLQKKPSFFIVENLILGNKKISLTTVLDPRDGKANEVSEQLKIITKTHQVILEERGSHDLSVGFPFVMGKFMDGTVVRAPLLFIPVQIWTENNQWYIARKPDSSLRLNRDFILAYGYRNQISPPEALIEMNFEDFPTEVLPFLTHLYDFLKESILEINFNRDLFELQLQSFERRNIEELRQVFETGILKLFPEAVLGFFPHHSSFLATDYAHLLNQSEAFPSIEDYFKPTDYSVNKIMEEDLFLGFPVDASQEETIREVKKGQSLVVIGPPGSGKSQLISNLITDFTSRGKKVLVVCQKKAALDTVTSRLTQIGLSPFTAQIHDLNSDKSQVFRQLQHQINHIQEYDKANNQLDSLALDKQFTWTSRRIQQIETELGNFKTALFDTSYCGKSIKELYLNVRNSAVLPLNSILFSEFRADDFSLFLEKIRSFIFFRSQIETANRHATFFRNLHKNQSDEWTSETETELIHQIQSYSHTFALLKEYTLQKNIHFTKELPFVLRSWIQIIEQVDNSLKESTFQHFTKDKPLITSELKKKLRTCISLSKDIQILVQASLIISPKHLDTLQNALTRAEKRAQISLIGKLIFKWINHAEYVLLKEWLPPKWTPESFEHLRKRIELTNMYHALYQEITEDKIEFRPNSIADFERLINAEKIRTKCKKTIQNTELTGLQKLICSFTSLVELVNWNIELTAKNSAWEDVKKGASLLSVEQCTYIESVHLANLQEAMPHNLPWVAELHRVSKTLKRSELALLELVDNATEPSQWLEHLQQSWCMFWINRIETQVPILQGVTSKKIQFLEDELQVLLQKKEEISQDKIRLSLREQACFALEKNRLNHLVSYRELGHQVGKKRQTWPLRKLMDVFSEDILKLIPCWLTTPEVAAGLFPIRDKQPLFDLVIFDEASQCPVEQGLPLILRGKQTVITGDPKQLPPFDLYQARIEHESEDNVFLEVESLLDAASFLFPQLQLNGHYRSQSIELIQFSNHYFYDNKLELIPDYQLVKSKEKTLFYRKVPGVWANNQNEREAEEVCNLVQEKWLENPEQHIGVITFNHTQAQLIEKKLEKLHFPSHFVRVKNIENVQGDEFDIVIFSIGYAPNMQQKMANHFGSLSMLGGEKRLNVAITRARRQLHVITSIEPGELQIDQTKNEGPKLLKAFLAYVLEVTTQEYSNVKKVSPNTLAYHLAQEDASMHFSPFPFSDLIVHEEGENLSLVLTDDNLYYSMKSTKQAHGYFPLLLRKKNWEFTRKWSRSLTNFIK